MTKTYAQALELLKGLGFSFTGQILPGRSTLVWNRQPRQPQILLPTPEVVEEVNSGGGCTAWVLKTGQFPRRICPTHLRIKPYSSWDSTQFWTKDDKRRLQDQLAIAESWVETGKGSRLSGRELVSYFDLWAEAVALGCRKAMDVETGIARLCQGYFDASMGHLLGSFTSVRTRNEIEVLGHSLVCEYPQQGQMPEEPRIAVKKLFAGYAAVMGFHLGATAKSSPGREFLHTDFVKLFTSSVCGLDEIDHRGLREISSGIRNAQVLANPVGTSNLPEFIRDRVTYVNACIAMIPGVTSSYAGSLTTGGQMALLGGAEVHPQMTRSHSLEDRFTDDGLLITPLQQAEEAGWEFLGVENFQVGGGLSRTGRAIEHLEEPRLFKILVPFGMKGMAPRTDRVFVEKRPDGFHRLDLVISSDDVKSKKAGACLVAMLASHVQKNIPSTYEGCLELIDEKLGYDSVPIFEIIPGLGSETVKLFDGTYLDGEAVPVKGTDGAQLYTVTGLVPLMVMPEGEHYGQALRGQDKPIGLSPWSIVPDQLPTPQETEHFRFLKALWDREPPAPHSDKTTSEDFDEEGNLVGGDDELDLDLLASLGIFE